MKYTYLYLGSFILANVASCQEVRTVKVLVHDEADNPIRDVNTIVTFLGHGVNDTQRKEGLTNHAGIFQASGTPSLRISVRMEKSGYYRSESGRLTRDRDHSSRFLLREIKQPIPLYAKKVHLQIPENREWIAYDLEEGDWVHPHGGGKVADLSLMCDTEMTGETTAKGQLKIKFSSIEEVLCLVKEEYYRYSRMKMPYLAPPEGYKNLWIRQEDSHHDTNAQQDVGYFLRTRVIEQDGKIISCNYGKISGDIRFDHRGSRWDAKEDEEKSYATVTLTYYFNPKPNDRNLEFDPSMNLFTELDPTERVHEP